MSELLLMLLADGRLPVAGHTQSGQLEAAVRSGLTADQVPDFLQARLASVVRVEAGTAVATLHALDAAACVGLDTPPPSGSGGSTNGPVGRAVSVGRAGSASERVETNTVAALTTIRDAWAARTPSPAMRATSRTLAKAMLRLAERLWPESGHIAAARELPGVCRPIVLGAIAAEEGLAGSALARLIAYDDLQTVASAALKLLPLDPVQATAWVHDGLADAETLATEVAGVITPEQIPAPSAPQLDQWAQFHATTTRRLFSA